MLIGDVNAVAPLLTMCFLACYISMNLSCFLLTVLKAPSWRPNGIHRRRWRVWYKTTSFVGASMGIAVMFVVSPLFAAAALSYAARCWSCGANPPQSSHATLDARCFCSVHLGRPQAPCS